jgi:hypothetical protein
MKRWTRGDLCLVESSEPGWPKRLVCIVLQVVVFPEPRARILSVYPRGWVFWRFLWTMKAPPIALLRRARRALEREVAEVTNQHNHVLFELNRREEKRG